MTVHGCAAVSRELDESPCGTAPASTSWVVPEQPGPWGHDAVHESDLPAPLAAGLTARCAAAQVRLGLIRRSPSRSEPLPTRTVLIARTGTDRSWLVRRELNDDELAGLPIEALGAGADPSGFGVPTVAPATLVCTHGRKDACCATFGRPVVRALRSAGFDVWETSHVGGDRFAANVVLLPSGVFLGHVEAACAVEVVGSALDGRLPLHLLRGRTGVSPAAQVAEVAVRRRLDLTGLDEVSSRPEPRPVALHELGSEAIEYVHVVAGERRFRVGVHFGRAPARPLTCRSGPAEPPVARVGVIDEVTPR